ncbi:type III pantothenate kinase [Microbulbifer salipaludis]|uniref:Type III pantothenate kinase n=1 Tax=Microbulbifer salipaludis TaxID=187980 RepID=A0ABS3E595_9GAMM|nr:type III pantothenate kinase [Microbulbifer salipaludis]MBN8430477.1 type III pantothenate kinase [Microbulbifer salipaludis]
MNILELDQGNTRAKWRLITDAGQDAIRVIERGVLGPGKWWLAETLPAAWRMHAPQRVRAANVAGAAVAEAICARLHGVLGLDVAFARVRAECGGVRCAYRDTSRLGVDRWLAVLAAFRRDPSPALVVDCGSAVTLDLLGAGGEHLGGYIVPGLGLMRRALYADTDAVKVAPPANVITSLAPGCDTAEAVNHGLPLMVLGAVERAYDDLAHRCAEEGSAAPRLLFCGGDGGALARWCDRPNVVVEDLVMEGLALTNP